MEKSYQKIIQNQKDDFEQAELDGQNQHSDKEIEQDMDRDNRVDFITRMASNARD